jgi:hypothetical protein
MIRGPGATGRNGGRSPSSFAHGDDRQSLQWQGGSSRDGVLGLPACKADERAGATPRAQRNETMYAATAFASASLRCSSGM